MRRIVGDYVINVTQIDDPIYGRGFTADTYINKTDGLKENVRVFRDYTGLIKTQTQMIDFVSKILLSL